MRRTSTQIRRSTSSARCEARRRECGTQKGAQDNKVAASAPGSQRPNLTLIHEDFAFWWAAVAGTRLGSRFALGAWPAPAFRPRSDHRFTPSALTASPRAAFPHPLPLRVFCVPVSSASLAAFHRSLPPLSLCARASVGAVRPPVFVSVPRRPAVVALASASGRSAPSRLGSARRARSPRLPSRGGRAPPAGRRLAVRPSRGGASPPPPFAQHIPLCPSWRPARGSGGGVAAAPSPDDPLVGPPSPRQSCMPHTPLPYISRRFPLHFPFCSCSRYLSHGMDPRPGTDREGPCGSK